MKNEHIQQINVIIGIITVSSTRTPETDSSGMIICELVKASGHSVGYYAVVKDNLDAIKSEIMKATHHANCIIVNGGTGLTSDDITIEAVKPILEKVIDGFGELFRFKSYEEIGTAAMLSRAIAGIYRKCVIFCIPGSNAAVKLATNQLIIPEITHILSHAAK